MSTPDPPIGEIVGRESSPGWHDPASTAASQIAQVGDRTANKRARGDRRSHHCYDKLHRSIDAHAADSAENRELRSADEIAWSDALESHSHGHREDQGRRTFSTAKYAALMTVIGVINIPLAAGTLQVLRLSLALTLLLALLADALWLWLAHAAGVTLRRGHTSHDAQLALGAERALGIALFMAGMAVALAMGWIRWDYINITGGGTGVGGTIFLTVLGVATFLMATWAAFAHHNGLLAHAERATRRRRRSDRKLEGDKRAIRRRAKRYAMAVNGRRILAQSITGQLDRILQHAQVIASRHGDTAAAVPLPAWAEHEYALAAFPVPGAPVQPLYLDPDALSPPSNGSSDIPPEGSLS